MFCCFKFHKKEKIMLKQIKKEYFNSKFFYIASSTLIILILLFPLLFSLQIFKELESFNGVYILLNKGLLIKNYNKEFFLNFPTALRLSVLLNIIFIFVAIFSFLFKKYLISAIFNIFSSMSVFLFLTSLKEIKNNIIELNIPNSFIFLNVLWPYVFCILFEIFLAVFSILRKGKDKLAESIFFCCSLISVLIVFSIFIYISIFGLPAIFKIGFLNFVFSNEWAPENGKFGILNLLLASIFSTLGALIFAVPLGVLAALYLSELANKKVAFVFNIIIEVLAAIPSVIYGLFGMTIIVPLIKFIFNRNSTSFVVGDSLLAAILVLFIMIIPTIVSTSYITLKSVPKSFKEASLNLGATKTQTIFKVTLKASKSGIFSGVTLAVAKAIGETMAVMMVAGNVVNPPNLLKPVRLLTTGIALDISYSSGLLRQALFGIGFVLFILIIIINISFKKSFKIVKF